MDAALHALGLEAEAGRLIQQQAGIGGVYDGRRTARLGAGGREAGRLIQQRAGIGGVHDRRRTARLGAEAGRLIQQQAGIGGVHDGRRTARLGAGDRGRETYTAAGRYRGCTRSTPHCAPWG